MPRLIFAVTVALAAMATAAAAAPGGKPGATPALPVVKAATQKCKAGWSFSKKAGQCVKNRYSAKPAPKVSRVRRSA